MHSPSAVPAEHTRGLVLSDAHLFAGHARRSPELFRTLAERLEGYDLCVLNGDMMEVLVPGMVLPDVVASCIHTIRSFCRQAMEVNPHCAIHYVIGNHEATEDYMRALQALAKEMPNLHIHPEYVCMGDAMFLHGDLPMYHKRLTQREAVKPYASGIGGFLTALYSPIQQLEVMVRARTSPVSRAVKTIADVLAKTTGLEHIHHVFFGHTHRPFAGLKEQGRSYYNTGAFNDGMQPMPLAFTFGEAGKIAHVEEVDLGIANPPRKRPNLTEFIANIRMTQAMMKAKQSDIAA